MKKLTKIKKLIKKNNLDAYIKPKNDEFFCNMHSQTD